MVAMILTNAKDVREARERAHQLARAAGVAEPPMVEQAVGEIGNNCVEHLDGTGTAILRLGCRPGKLTLEAENPCQEPPTWQTRKPELMDGIRLGGYGLVLIRAIAQNARFEWRDGRALVRAEFA